MMVEWLYGDSWEKYSITEGEIWTHPQSGSLISVCDLRDGLPEYVTGAQMVYSDPPWSKGNVNSFVTKAGLASYVNDFRDFVVVLFAEIQRIGPAACYLEIGRQHLTDIEDGMRAFFPIVQVWDITYYHKHRCYLVRGARSLCGYNYTGLDDAKTPATAIQIEQPESVADPCTGRGLTMLSAHQVGVRFLGTELNRRRLAVAISHAAAIGIAYKRVDGVVSFGAKA